jgi:hypothetical protein
LDEKIGQLISLKRYYRPSSPQNWRLKIALFPRQALGAVTNVNVDDLEYFDKPREPKDGFGANAFANFGGHARAGNVRWRCAVIGGFTMTRHLPSQNSPTSYWAARQKPKSFFG